MQHLLPADEKDGGDLCCSSSAGAGWRINPISVSYDPLGRRGQSEGSGVHVASRCAAMADKESGFLREILSELESCERGGSAL